MTQKPSPNNTEVGEAKYSHLHEAALLASDVALWLVEPYDETGDQDFAARRARHDIESVVQLTFDDSSAQPITESYGPEVQAMYDVYNELRQAGVPPDEALRQAYGQNPE